MRATGGTTRIYLLIVWMEGNTVTSTLTPLLLIFALAVMTEGIVEYLGLRLPTAAKPYAAALLAVLVCVAYNADLLALLGFRAALPYAGPVLTGLVIGRGSNYLADIVKRLQVVPTPAAPVDAIVSDRPSERPSRSAVEAANSAPAMFAAAPATPPVAASGPAPTYNHGYRDGHPLDGAESEPFNPRV